MPRELSVLQFYNRRKSEGGKDHFLPYSSVGIKLPSLAPPPCQMEEFSCPSIIKPGLSLCAQLLSCVRHFATPWTVSHQAPLSLGFPRQEYWNGLPFPTPGDLPRPGIKPMSPAFVGGFFTSEPPGKPTLSRLHIYLLPLSSVCQQFHVKFFSGHSFK